MSGTLVALIVFGGITTGVAALFMLLRDLSASGAGSAGQAGASVQLRQFPLSRRTPPPRTTVGEFDQWFERLVVESGLPWTTTTALLLLMLGGLAIGGVVLLWLDAPVPATAGAFAGMGLVLLYLVVVRAQRIRRLQEQLPQALETLARAVHAGESLEQAMEMVGRQTPDPLGIEFRRCTNQLAMGLSLAAVMRSLVHRVRLLDFKIFTTTLTVHRAAGGNLANTLERLSAVMRERLNARRQMRATTAAGRMSATFMLVLGPLVFAYMFFWQQEYVSGLLESSMGQSMLMAAVFLEIVGLIWITRMLRDDY